MTRNDGLRKRIENTIGGKMLSRFCHNRIGKSGPIMMPPLPDSKFIDKLPEGDLEGANLQEKNHQESYEAEVRLYRCLELAKAEYLVIHQLEFTHEQYSAFLPEHGKCTKMGCKNGQDDHSCHKKPREIEGEIDLVVVLNDVVCVLEVKGLVLQGTNEDDIRFKGCYESAQAQRKRLKDLIHAIDSSVAVFEFTAFPNIFIDDVNLNYLNDATLLFFEDLEDLPSIIELSAAYSPPVSRTDRIATRDKLYSCLLGLWFVNVENKWDGNQGSMTRQIKKVDNALKKALITRKLFDQSEKYLNGEKGKVKVKKYPENPELIEAPDLFKNHLNINCLTKDQLDVFHCKERFVWIDGPAGSGKTVVMLGKIIDVIENGSADRVILLIGAHHRTPVLENYLRIIRTVTSSCEFVCYDYYHLKGDVTEMASIAYKSLMEKLAGAKSKVIILGIRSTILPKSFYSIFTKFDHIFVDDFQMLIGLMVHFNSNYENHGNVKILSEGLLLLAKFSNINDISLWIFLDEGQALSISFVDDDDDGPVTKIKAVLTEFKSVFSTFKELSINLRNTYEISTVLSNIRRHFRVMETAIHSPVNLPILRRGHFFRGTKPIIYLLRDDDPASWREILKEELEKLKRDDYCLENKDIAILTNAVGDDNHRNRVDTTVKSVVEPWNTADDKIKVCTTIESMSAEWPATISIYRSSSGSLVQMLHDGTFVHGMDITVLLSLNIALSRARVHAAAIIYNYFPKKMGFNDKFFQLLRYLRCVCTVIEID